MHTQGIASKQQFVLKNGKILAFYTFPPFYSDAHLLGERVSTKKSREVSLRKRFFFTVDATGPAPETGARAAGGSVAGRWELTAHARCVPNAVLSRFVPAVQTSFCICVHCLFMIRSCF